MSSSEDSSDSSTEFKSESSSESTSKSTSLSPLRVKKHGGGDSKRHSSCYIVEFWFLTANSLNVTITIILIANLLIYCSNVYISYSLNSVCILVSLF